MEPVGSGLINREVEGTAKFGGECLMVYEAIWGGKA